MGSMMAVEVREYPSISTRSNGMAASERPSRMASPLRPPANPAASTGTSRVLRDLATLTPFPPANVMLSGALCLWPSVRLGTTSVLATAALRVTVRIMPLPTYLLFEKSPQRYTTPAARARPSHNPSLREAGSPRPSSFKLYEGLAESDRSEASFPGRYSPLRRSAKALPGYRARPSRRASRRGLRSWLSAFLTRGYRDYRSEEHTSELQSQSNLVCRLLLEKKKK